MDYSVPWDDFDKYDLIILSREGHEYVTFYRERDVSPANKGQARWLTSAQEQKFEDYVEPVPLAGFLPSQCKCVEVLPGRPDPRIPGWHLQAPAGCLGIPSSPGNRI
jgi:hypothetical protein